MIAMPAGSRKTATAQGAFTLIELLVVIAIIAILAALILGVSGFVQEKAGNTLAQTQISALEVALESYKQDNGVYPASADGDDDKSTSVLLDALNPTDGTKVYFEIPPKMLDQYSSKSTADDNRKNSTYLVDPFGNAYHYQFPGKDDRNGKDFFDLWSYGKNPTKNKGNEQTWLKNW